MHAHAKDFRSEVEGEDAEALSEGLSIVESAIASGRPARFSLQPDTQHTFDAVHPFAGPTTALRRAWAESAAFLETYLLRFDPAVTRAARGWSG